MAVKVGDQSPGELSRRFLQKAKDSLNPAELLLVLPAVGYSFAMLGYYFARGVIVQSAVNVAILAAVPVIAFVGFSNARVRPWVPLAAIVLCYEALQGVIASFVSTKALYSLYNLDFSIWGFNVTGWIQSTFYSPAVTYVSSFFYSLHLPLIVVTSVALWRFNKELFGKYVTAMVLTSYAALATFILMPTAPPWYEGVARDLFYGGSSVLPSGLLNFVSMFESDKFAAFPSLHTAYAIIFSYFMIKLDRRLAYVAVPITAGVMFSTLYLGQHYLLDIFAGAAYALIPCLIAERLRIVPFGNRKATAARSGQKVAPAITVNA